MRSNASRRPQARTAPVPAQVEYHEFASVRFLPGAAAAVLGVPASSGRSRPGWALTAIDSGPPLADVAQRCGYADQAHLTREVRSLAGAPPSARA